MAQHSGHLFAIIVISIGCSTVQVTGPPTLSRVREIPSTMFKSSIANEIEESESIQIRHLALSNDGTYIGYESDTKGVRVCDNSTKASITIPGNPNCFAFSHNGDSIATYDPTGDVVVRDLKSLKELHRVRAGNAAITMIRFSFDDSRLLMASAGIGVMATPYGELSLLNLLSGRFEWSIQTDDGPVVDFSFSPDGSQCVVATISRRRQWLQRDVAKVRWLDMKHGELIHAESIPSRLVTCVTYTPEGDFVLTSYSDGRMTCWRRETRTRIFDGPVGCGPNAYLSSDPLRGQVLISGDDGIGVLNVKNILKATIYIASIRRVHTVISHDGSTVAYLQKPYVIEVLHMSNP